METRAGCGAPLRKSRSQSLPLVWLGGRPDPPEPREHYERDPQEPLEGFQLVPSVVTPVSVLVTVKPSQAPLTPAWVSSRNVPKR